VELSEAQKAKQESYELNWQKRYYVMTGEGFNSESG
jgi:hypothetical protein